MARSWQTAFRKLQKKLGFGRPVELKEVQDQIGVAGRQQLIPKVVYQTAESRLVHPTHEKSILEFRRKNLDLDFVFFDSKARNKYMKETWGWHPVFSVYRDAIFGQMKADIFRYCIIFERGGYYIDFNKGIDAKITAFHQPNAEGLISYESNPELIFPGSHLVKILQKPLNLVVQWAFGFVPEHRFLGQLLEEIPQAAVAFRGQNFENPKSALLTLSATGMFTKVFREYAQVHGTETIHQAGIDFEGRGIFRLRGSKYLWRPGQHYSEQRNLPLFR